MSSLVKEVVGLQDPDVCYQCRRCTSGCPVAFLEPDYRPHRIVAQVNLGRVEELLRSEVIWKCTRCYKCTEYCPQRVAPSDVILSLQALAAERVGLPGEFKDMIERLARTGYTFEVMEVADSELEVYDRGSLGLPELKPPSRMDVLGRIIRRLGGVE